MPDDDDGDIGREVVSAVMLQFFTTDIALIGNLKVAAEHLALAAMGAAAERAAPQGLSHISLIESLGLIDHQLSLSPARAF